MMDPYFASYFPMNEDNVPGKVPTVPSTQDIFLSLVTDRVNVADDKAKLASDSALETSDQSALDADVASNGPALVKDGAGNPFALLPPAAGTTTTQEIPLRDGTVEPTPPPPPAGP